MRCAAIDIGTNSCRLLIADASAEGLRPLYRDIKTTRVGEGLGEQFHLQEEAIERSISCLDSFRNIVEEMEVDSYRVVATSALREAENQEDFLRRARERTAMQVQVISSEEEAHLSYLGVSRGLPDIESPLVADLGGGSLELILEGADPIFLSFPLGAVRAMEQNLKITEITAIMSSLALHKDDFAPHPLVVVGGTATSLVTIKLSLDLYDVSLVHGQLLSRGEIADIYNMLERMPLNLRRRLPGLQAARADIIPWGTRIVLLLMDMLGKEETTISESDLLEGIIWGLI
ncbi:MAG: Ppx/GppA family phosphatase [Syntrophomonas sp.]|uniref:Ppx/GppA phosphatase family protein n=1 Tax=Syntrophomonas sp. TaxID=2053627 RepID=UPI00261EE88E|nr:Ppx/GppA family phosphatase [Syntrophomonas sp.]MDD2510457.1 Ppx/GppA family phosphatase [Syntrophomonas sp.]MDD4627280.1 Ppx/GppA family phosphatase [Syntrophomonas sp.]